jgi:hypothetical protein
MKSIRLTTAAVITTPGGITVIALPKDHVALGVSGETWSGPGEVVTLEDDDADRLLAQNWAAVIDNNF